MYGIGEAFRPFTGNDLMYRFNQMNPDLLQYLNRLRLQQTFNQFNPGQMAPYMPTLGFGQPTQTIGPGPVGAPAFTPPVQPVIGQPAFGSLPNPGTAMTFEVPKGGRQVGMQGDRSRSNAGRSAANPFVNYVASRRS